MLFTKLFSKKGWKRQRVEVEHAVPPAVLADRERLRQDHPMSSSSGLGGVDEFEDEGIWCYDEVIQPGGFTETLTASTAAESNVLVSASGETLVRHRRNAPLTPVNPPTAGRGSLELALTIARSETLSLQAERAFGEMIYAPSTSAGKEALFSTWKGICEARGFAALPLTEASLRTCAAILRAAGYRSTMSYLYEAKNRHTRSGFPWNPSLQAVLMDCKRGATRGIAATKKSAEVKLVVWSSFLDSNGANNFEQILSSRAPNCGALGWIFGSGFLLREVELSCITLDTRCMNLDVNKRLVTLYLPVSKNDPMGRGAKRTLGCCCPRDRRVWDCVFHAASDLVRNQLDALGVQEIGELEPNKFPLVGRFSDPTKFVDKVDLISEVHRQLEVASELVVEAEGIVIEDVTGHFMRRSGIKALARRGVSFASIQWLARHSSQVTWEYVEEAWGENPHASLRMHDDLALNEVLASTLARVTKTEEAVASLESDLTEKLKHDGFPVAECPDFSDVIKREVKNSLVPEFVCNSNTSVVHVTCKSSCMNRDPKTWSTKCGWFWVRSAGISKLYYESDDIPDHIRRCGKCFN